MHVKIVMKCLMLSVFISIFKHLSYNILETEKYVSVQFNAQKKNVTVVNEGNVMVNIKLYGLFL